MELIKGNKYTYTNTYITKGTCKRITTQQKVVYVGTEGNTQVFETEFGTEIFLHKDAVVKFISE